MLYDCDKNKIWLKLCTIKMLFSGYLLLSEIILLCKVPAEQDFCSVFCDRINVIFFNNQSQYLCQTQTQKILFFGKSY